MYHLSIPQSLIHLVSSIAVRKDKLCLVNPPFFQWQHRGPLKVYAETCDGRFESRSLGDLWYFFGKPNMSSSTKADMGGKPNQTGLWGNQTIPPVTDDSR